MNLGFIAATCMAMPLASSSEPPLSATSTPMRPLCEYAPIGPSFSTLAMRRTSNFSPMVRVSVLAPSSTVPSPSLAAFSAAISDTPDSSATLATSLVNWMNCSLREEKSVSLLTSTRTALPAFCATAMRPSAATRSAFLSALARPFLRSHSIAASMSPLFSTSAFLHSIMPTLERSRSSLTRLAVISAMVIPQYFDKRRGGHAAAPDETEELDRVGRLRAATTTVTAAFATRSTLLVRGAATIAARGIVLRDRVAFFVQLDELVGVATGSVRRSSLAFEDRVGSGAGVQLDGADGVVVTRDGVVDEGRVVVGIDDGDDRDAELAGFLDGDVFVTDVDDEQGVRQTIHVLDAAQRVLQLVALTATGQHFVLDQLLERTVGFGGFEFLQAGDRLLDRAEVGQHATEPTGGDERLAGARGFFGQRLTGGALGADEKHGAALLGQARKEMHRVGEERERLLEVDDVDLAAGAEDVRSHLGVPVTGLVAEMDAGFQHLAHGDLCHGNTPGRTASCGSMGVGTSTHPRLRPGPVGPGTPKAVPMRVWR